MALAYAMTFLSAEDATDLEKLGLTPSSTNSTQIDCSADSYYGPPGQANGEGVVRLDLNKTLTLPADVGGAGALCCNVDQTAGPWNGATLLSVQFANTGRFTYITMSSSGALNLYVDSVFKASSSVINWQTARRTVALHYDSTGTSHKAKVFIDGTEVISEQTDSGSAETSSVCKVHGASSTDRATRFAQVRQYDAYADTPGTPWVMSRNFTTDTSATGTWTPDTGSDRFARIDRPYNASEYVDSSNPPSASDLFVESAGTIDSMCGLSVANIQGVAAVFSTSGQNEVQALVGSVAGTAKTIADADVHTVFSMDSTTSYSGSDTPTATFKVVS